MHPACQLCRGACCESLVLNLPPTDSGTWLAYHARPLGGALHEIESRCTKLAACGRCTIHATRPEHCRTYPVGGPDCRATVSRRRAVISEQIISLLNTRRSDTP